MRFSCGLTWEEKLRRKEQFVRQLREWETFFAVWPRTVAEKNGKKVCVMFKHIQRRYPCADLAYKGMWIGSPEYREIPDGR